MKTIKIIYWITTAIIGLMMTYSAYAYLTQPMATQGFHHLGYPDYFRVELAIAKLIGVALLLAPLASWTKAIPGEGTSVETRTSVGARVKEWVYAGFAFTFISAFIAHSASGDPAGNRLAPIIFLVLLAISYFSYHRLHRLPKTI
jgi:hypothetical protein